MELRKESYIHTEKRYSVNWAALKPYSRDPIMYKLDSRSYKLLCDYVHYAPQTTHSRSSRSLGDSRSRFLSQPLRHPATPHAFPEFTQGSAPSHHPSAVPHTFREHTEGSTPSYHQIVVARPQPGQVQRNQVVPRHYDSFVSQIRQGASPPPPKKEPCTALIVILALGIVGAGIYGLVHVTTKSKGARMGWAFLNTVFAPLKMLLKPG
jgi:hypothetical protein